MASIAQTRSGKLEGEERAGIHVFRGCPSQRRPSARSAGSPPEREAPWSGVRSARSFGNASPQNPLPLGLLAAFKIEEPQNEDCLYLNFWTPGLDGARGFVKTAAEKGLKAALTERDAKFGDGHARVNGPELRDARGHLKDG